VRRLALLLVAAVALAAVGGAADARPRKRLRGHVVAKRAGLPRAARPLPVTGTRAAPPALAATPAPSPTDPPPPPPPLPAGSGRSVQARTDDRTLSELRLVLSRTTVLAGAVKVEFNNAFAQDPHDLLLERADGSGPSYAFDELGPGEIATRSVALDAGTWRLRCTIPTHAERGMTATLGVVGY